MLYLAILVFDDFFEFLFDVQKMIGHPIVSLVLVLLPGGVDFGMSIGVSTLASFEFGAGEEGVVMGGVGAGVEGGVGV